MASLSAPTATAAAATAAAASSAATAAQGSSTEAAPVRPCACPRAAASLKTTEQQPIADSELMLSIGTVHGLKTCAALDVLSASACKRMARDCRGFSTDFQSTSVLWHGWLVGREQYVEADHVANACIRLTRSRPAGSASEFTDGSAQQAQKDNDGVKATYKMICQPRARHQRNHRAGALSVPRRVAVGLTGRFFVGVWSSLTRRTCRSPLRGSWKLASRRAGGL